MYGILVAKHVHLQKLKNGLSQEEMFGNTSKFEFKVIEPNQSLQKTETQNNSTLGWPDFTEASNKNDP